MKVKSYDGNTIGSSVGVLTIAGGDHISLPRASASMAMRSGYWPLFAGLSRQPRPLTLALHIVHDDLELYREMFFGIFNPEDETPKKLIIMDDDDTNERYVYAICTAFYPQREEGKTINRLYFIDLVVHGDVRWLAETKDSGSWSITASGQTKTLDNSASDDEAYPLLKIKPTSAKTGGYAYKRWVPVRWRVESSETRYPYELTDGGFDTDALVTASKAQADGDDFRVVCDGVEIDRWFGSGSYAFDQTTTKVWANLDFEADVPMTLKTAIASSGSVDEVEVNEDISLLPLSGIVLIDSEAFVYTDKNNSGNKLQGVTRAARGTSMAAHTADTDVYWIQHDLWFMYGNSGASAPDVDDDYKPVFDLDGSNTSWDYDNFRGPAVGNKRAGSWRGYTSYWGDTIYSANQMTDADPASEMGVAADVWIPRQSGWSLRNPCGLTAANFQNGEKYAYAQWSSWGASLRSYNPDSGIVEEYEIVAPTADDTWQSWSQNETLTSGSIEVKMVLSSVPDGVTHALEVSDVTVTLNSSNVPTTSFIGSEQGAYELDCVITNEYSEEAIALNFVMGLDEELEVDTYNKTVTYLEDDSKQMQALTVVDGPRKHWLRLLVGSHGLRFDDTGTNAVTISYEWRKRYFN